MAKAEEEGKKEESLKLLSVLFIVFLTLPLFFAIPVHASDSNPDGYGDKIYYEYYAQNNTGTFTTKNYVDYPYYTSGMEWSVVPNEHTIININAWLEASLASDVEDALNKSRAYITIDGVCTDVLMNYTYCIFAGDFYILLLSYPCNSSSVTDTWIPDPNTDYLVSIRYEVYYAGEWHIVETWNIHYQTLSDTYYYTLYGPLYEDGTVPEASISVTAIQTNSTPFTFTMTSDGADAGIYNVSADQPIILFYWNISDPAQNKTRQMYTRDLGPSSLSLYIPKDTEAVGQCEFVLTDLVGASDVYVKSSVSIDGVWSGVERFPFSSGSSSTFWFITNHAYLMTLSCNYGTLQMLWVAGPSTFNWVLTANAFPTVQAGYFNFSANRSNAGAYITAVYRMYNYMVDSDLLIAESMNVSFCHFDLTSYSWLMDYSANESITYSSGVSQYASVLWTGADADTTYRIDFTVALNNTGTLKNSVMSTGTLPSGSSPFAGFDAILGAVPYPMSQLIAVGLVLLFFGIGSYWSGPIACFLGSAIASLLWAIGWFTSVNPGGLAFPPMIGLAWLFTVLYSFGRGKKTEREV